MEYNKQDQVFLNFPIQLLEGFLQERERCMNDILFYCSYNHAQILEFGDDEEKMRAAGSHFGFQIIDPESALYRGDYIFEQFNNGKKPPLCGINKSIFLDYFFNKKTEYQDVCLLAFVGLKSIIGDKPYCKMTNNFLLGRMAGKSKSIANNTELPNELQMYAGRYQLDKIKGDLQDHWNLTLFSDKGIRGYYVSFKMEKDKLAELVISNLKNIRDKKRRLENKIAKQNAMASIEKNHYAYNKAY